MTPREALDYLTEMKCVGAHGIGMFRVSKAPRAKRDFDLFVSCIRCLGAYSVGDGPWVQVTCGGDANETIFKVIKG